MTCKRFRCLPVFMVMTGFAGGSAAPVTTVAELVAAVNQGAEGALVEIGQGTFSLTAPLTPKSGMTIRGAGAGKTIIEAAPSWQPGIEGLPDHATNFGSVNQGAYLINLGNKSLGVTLSDMTLTGPNLHGAICGNNPDSLVVQRMRLENFLWCGIRTYLMDHAKIHDNEFIDAAGKVKINGGALYLTYVKNSEFWNNRISKSPGSEKQFFGFKGRQAKHCRFHHNEVLVTFSFEFPFENDEFVEIDHNRFTGTISVPKWRGGSVPKDGYTFHIHHNWIQRSYALEWSRNGTKIHHNLFDFDLENDNGNLITDHGNEPYPGPTIFHDNLIKNPGRGVFWGKGAGTDFAFYNNHVIANTTVTPRKEGLFGFSTATDFSTVSIRDNIFEVLGTPRPLMRNEASYAAAIENNQMTGITDSDKFANPGTGQKQGPKEPLLFQVGVNGEYTVDGWNVTKGGGLAVNGQESRDAPRFHESRRSTTQMGPVFDLQGRRAVIHPWRVEFRPVR